MLAERQIAQKPTRFLPLLKWQWKAWSAIAIAVGTLLSGCGTVVPKMTETYDVSDELANQLMVQAIVASVRCELKRGVTDAIDEGLDVAQRSHEKPSYVEFLHDWGAEVALTLTIVEKTAVGPSALLTPSTVVAVAGGVSATAKATRVEKLNFFYTVKELYMHRGEICDASQEDGRGSFLVQNDLKIGSILRDRIILSALRQASAPSVKDSVSGHTNVLSHEVTFETIFDGTVTPTFKLVRATANPTAPFFDANRDRTHDLVVTFGPIARGKAGGSLIAIAEQSHYISQIQSGFRTAFPQ